MSYILEALRKSERQRRELEAQPLVRLAAYPAAAAPRRWRPALVTGLVFINATAILSLLWYRSGREAAVARPSTPQATSAMPIDQDAASRTAAAALSADSPTPAVPAMGAPTRTAPRSLGMTTETKASAGRPRPMRDAAPGPRPALPARRSPTPAPLAPTMRESGAVTASAADGDDPEQTTLGPKAQRHRKGKPAVNSAHGSPVTGRRTAAPPEPLVPNPVVDDSLPRPKINVYAYSATRESDRFVVIGGHKYHEGDRLDDGPAIRRIEETAVTLDFEGRTYKMPRP